jgi:tRNA (guanine-N1)-methyltransferase
MGFQARILTVLPDMFPGVLGQSVPGRALSQGLWAMQVVDIRDFSRDKHRSVDDTPAGGGPGMVLRPDVVADALDSLVPARRRVYVGPRGKRFDQAMARQWAQEDGVDFLCGRFEGVDERVLEARGFEEISLGDFVLFGGEVAAQAMLEAVVRLLPGVLGAAGSLEEESFADGLLEHPQYTRPTIWEGREIPDILSSGHHGRIANWRKERSLRLTKEHRPDLWKSYVARQAARV